MDDDDDQQKTLLIETLWKKNPTAWTPCVMKKLWCVEQGVTATLFGHGHLPLNYKKKAEKNKNFIFYTPSYKCYFIGGRFVGFYRGMGHVKVWEIFFFFFVKYGNF